jgi:hypothetical protein
MHHSRKTTFAREQLKRSVACVLARQRLREAIAQLQGKALELEVLGDAPQVRSLAPSCATHDAFYVFDWRSVVSHILSFCPG